MVRLIPILILLLATEGFAASAPPVIVGPVEPVDVKEYAMLMVTGISDADLAKTTIVTWPREGVTTFSGKGWAGSPFVLFRAKSAGKYLVYLDLPTGPGCECIVQVGPPTPVPPPIPPDPTPPPGPQKLQLVIVEETSKATPAIAAIKSSPVLRTYAKDKGHKLWFLDKDLGADAPAGFAPWFKAAAGSGKPLPVAMVVTEAGAILATETLPGTVQATLDLLKKWGG